MGIFDPIIATAEIKKILQEIDRESDEDTKNRLRRKLNFYVREQLGSSVENLDIFCKELMSYENGDFATIMDLMKNLNKYESDNNLESSQKIAGELIDQFDKYNFQNIERAVNEKNSEILIRNLQFSMLANTIGVKGDAQYPYITNRGGEFYDLLTRVVATKDPDFTIKTLRFLNDNTGRFFEFSNGKLEIVKDKPPRFQSHDKYTNNLQEILIFRSLYSDFSEAEFKSFYSAIAAEIKAQQIIWNKTEYSPKLSGDRLLFPSTIALELNLNYYANKFQKNIPLTKIEKVFFESMIREFSFEITSNYPEISSIVVSASLEAIVKNGGKAPDPANAKEYLFFLKYLSKTQSLFKEMGIKPVETRLIATFMGNVTGTWAENYEKIKGYTEQDAKKIAVLLEDYIRYVQLPAAFVGLDPTKITADEVSLNRSKNAYLIPVTEDFAQKMTFTDLLGTAYNYMANDGRKRNDVLNTIRDQSIYEGRAEDPNFLVHGLFVDAEGKYTNSVKVSVQTIAGTENFQFFDITNAREQQAEYIELKHCVNKDSYMQKLLAGDAHMVSIRDMNGKPRSTMEIKFVDLSNPEANSFFYSSNKTKGLIPGTGDPGRAFIIRQHKTYNDGDVTDNTSLKLGEAFADMLRSGPETVKEKYNISLNTEKLGRNFSYSDGTDGKSITVLEDHLGSKGTIIPEKVTSNYTIFANIPSGNLVYDEQGNVTGFKESQSKTLIPGFYYDEDGNSKASTPKLGATDEVKLEAYRHSNNRPQNYGRTIWHSYNEYDDDRRIIARFSDTYLAERINYVSRNYGIPPEEIIILPKFASQGQTPLDNNNPMTIATHAGSYFRGNRYQTARAALISSLVVDNNKIYTKDEYEKSVSIISTLENPLLSDAERFVAIQQLNPTTQEIEFAREAFETTKLNVDLAHSKEMMILDAAVLSGHPNSQMAREVKRKYTPENRFNFSDIKPSAPNLMEEKESKGKKPVKPDSSSIQKINTEDPEYIEIRKKLVQVIVLEDEFNGLGKKRQKEINVEIDKFAKEIFLSPKYIRQSFLDFVGSYHTTMNGFQPFGSSLTYGQYTGEGDIYSIRLNQISFFVHELTHGLIDVSNSNRLFDTEGRGVFDYWTGALAHWADTTPKGMTPVLEPSKVTKKERKMRNDIIGGNYHLWSISNEFICQLSEVYRDAYVKNNGNIEATNKAMEDDYPNIWPSFRDHILPKLSQSSDIIHDSRQVFNKMLEEGKIKLIKGTKVLANTKTRYPLLQEVFYIYYDDSNNLGEAEKKVLTDLFHAPQKNSEYGTVLIGGPITDEVDPKIHPSYYRNDPVTEAILSYHRSYMIEHSNNMYIDARYKRGATKDSNDDYFLFDDDYVNGLKKYLLTSPEFQPYLERFTSDTDKQKIIDAHISFAHYLASVAGTDQNKNNIPFIADEFYIKYTVAYENALMKGALDVSAGKLDQEIFNSQIEYLEERIYQELTEEFKLRSQNSPVIAVTEEQLRQSQSLPEKNAITNDPFANLPPIIRKFLENQGFDLNNFSDDSDDFFRRTQTTDVTKKREGHVPYEREFTPPEREYPRIPIEDPLRLPVHTEAVNIEKRFIGEKIYNKAQMALIYLQFAQASYYSSIGPDGKPIDEMKAKMLYESGMHSVKGLGAIAVIGSGLSYGEGAFKQGIASYAAHTEGMGAKLFASSQLFRNISVAVPLTTLAFHGMLAYNAPNAETSNILMVQGGSVATMEAVAFAAGGSTAATTAVVIPLAEIVNTAIYLNHSDEGAMPPFWLQGYDMIHDARTESFVRGSVIDATHTFESKVNSYVFKSANGKEVYSYPLVRLTDNFDQSTSPDLAMIAGLAGNVGGSTYDQFIKDEVKITTDFPISAEAQKKFDLYSLYYYSNFKASNNIGFPQSSHVVYGYNTVPVERNVSSFDILQLKNTELGNHIKAEERDYANAERLIANVKYLEKNKTHFNNEMKANGYNINIPEFGIDIENLPKPPRISDELMDFAEARLVATGYPEGYMDGLPYMSKVAMVRESIMTNYYQASEAMKFQIYDHEHWEVSKNYRDAQELMGRYMSWERNMGHFDYLTKLEQHFDQFNQLDKNQMASFQTNMEGFQKATQAEGYAEAIRSSFSILEEWQAKKGTSLDLNIDKKDEILLQVQEKIKHCKENGFQPADLQELDNIMKSQIELIERYQSLIENYICPKLTKAKESPYRSVPNSIVIENKEGNRKGEPANDNFDKYSYQFNDNGPVRRLTLYRSHGNVIGYNVIYDKNKLPLEGGEINLDKLDQTIIDQIEKKLNDRSVDDPDIRNTEKVESLKQLKESIIIIRKAEEEMDRRRQQEIMDENIRNGMLMGSIGTDRINDFGESGYYIRFADPSLTSTEVTTLEQHQEYDDKRVAVMRDASIGYQVYIEGKEKAPALDANLAVEVSLDPTYRFMNYNEVISAGKNISPQVVNNEKQDVLVVNLDNEAANIVSSNIFKEQIKAAEGQYQDVIINLAGKDISSGNMESIISNLDKIPVLFSVSKDQYDDYNRAIKAELDDLSQDLPAFLNKTDVEVATSGKETLREYTGEFVRKIEDFEELVERELGTIAANQSEQVKEEHVKVLLNSYAMFYENYHASDLSVDMDQDNKDDIQELRNHLAVRLAKVYAPREGELAEASIMFSTAFFRQKLEMIEDKVKGTNINDALDYITQADINREPGKRGK